MNTEGVWGRHAPNARPQQITTIVEEYKNLMQREGKKSKRFMRNDILVGNGGVSFLKYPTKSLAPYLQWFTERERKKYPESMEAEDSEAEESDEEENEKPGACFQTQFHFFSKPEIKLSKIAAVNKKRAAAKEPDKPAPNKKAKKENRVLEALLEFSSNVPKKKFNYKTEEDALLLSRRAYVAPVHHAAYVAPVHHAAYVYGNEAEETNKTEEDALYLARHGYVAPAHHAVVAPVYHQNGGVTGFLQ